MANEFQQIPDKLPEPWSWDNSDLTPQLRREMSNEHILFSKSLKTIVRRQDNDDVLFELKNDNFKYAIVHLTWAQETLLGNHYPRTELFKDWNDLYTNRILFDKNEYG